MNLRSNRKNEPCTNPWNHSALLYITAHNQYGNFIPLDPRKSPAHFITCRCFQCYEEVQFKDSMYSEFLNVYGNKLIVPMDTMSNCTDRFYPMMKPVEDMRKENLPEGELVRRLTNLSKALDMDKLKEAQSLIHQGHGQPYGVSNDLNGTSLPNNAPQKLYYYE